jgi:hypothetical protein
VNRAPGRQWSMQWLNNAFKEKKTREKGVEAKEDIGRAKVYLNSVFISRSQQERKDTLL